MSTSSSSSQPPSCLHLLMCSDADRVQACLAHCSPGDSLLLLDQAVTLLLDRGLEWNPEWNPEWDTGSGLQLYALKSDVLARGMGLNASGCEYMDDSGWVDLVMKHPHCLSWK